jgi:hypothetical protein
MACLICSVSCLAQKIELNNIATVTSKNKISKLPANQINSFIGMNFKNAKDRNLENVLKFQLDCSYVVNGMLVTIKAANAKTRYASNYLQLMKDALDGMSDRIKGYSSRIENIGGRAVLVTLTPSATADISAYYFYVVDSSLKHCIAGTLPYKMSTLLKQKKPYMSFLKIFRLNNFGTL